MDSLLDSALGADDDSDAVLLDDFGAADSDSNEAGQLPRQQKSNSEQRTAGPEEDPASFSRIDLCQSDAQNRAAFPLFPVSGAVPLGLLLRLHALAP